MTKFIAILAVTAPDPKSNNKLLLESIGDCDKAGLLVDEALFEFHRYEFSSTALRSLILKVSGENSFDYAGSDELEEYIKDLWALNRCEIDAQTVSVALT